MRLLGYIGLSLFKAGVLMLIFSVLAIAQARGATPHRHPFHRRPIPARESTAYAVENWLWPCDQVITWNTSDNQLRVWATPIITEIESLSGLNFAWTDDPTSANVTVEWDPNDPLFKFDSISQYNQYPAVGATDRWANKSDWSFTGYAHVHLNPMVLAPAGIHGWEKRKNTLPVLMHELGHAAGLDHVFYDPWEIMNSPQNWNLKDYGPGDKAGLRVVGCPR